MMTVHVVGVGHAFFLLLSVSCELYDRPDLSGRNMIASMERHFGSALSFITEKVGRLVTRLRSLVISQWARSVLSEVTVTTKGLSA